MSQEFPKIPNIEKVDQVADFAIGVLKFATNSVQFVADVGHRLQGKPTHGELENANKYDSLTNSPTRGYFFRQLDKLLKSKEAPQTLMLAHVDAIDFKSINDSYGHPIGDSALKVSSWIMEEFFNAPVFKHDVPNYSRIGGDEFLGVVLEGDYLGTDKKVFENAIEFGRYTSRRSGEESDGVSLDFKQILENIDRRSWEDEIPVYNDLRLLVTLGINDMKYRYFVDEIQVVPGMSAEAMVDDFKFVNGIQDTPYLRSEPR